MAQRQRRDVGPKPARQFEADSDVAGSRAFDGLEQVCEKEARMKRRIRSLALAHALTGAEALAPLGRLRHFGHFGHIGRLALLAPPLVAGAGAALAGCQIYVDEPARRPNPPAPPPPPPVVRQQPAPPREQRVVTLRMHSQEPATTSGTGAGACFDTSNASVGDCAAVPASGTCSGAASAQQICNAFKTYFIPKAAAAAVSCLSGLTSTQACDLTQVSTCGRNALVQACPASSVSQLCQIAATSCKTTASDCSSVLSGLNDQGQEAVAQCVAQGCTGGLLGCIDALAVAKH
jgi:hypothetical protein